MSVWDGLRLVAVDLETCRAPDHTDRVVSIGVVVTTRRGRVASWSRRVNPGVHITEETTRIHHLEDADVAGADPFADLVPEILRSLKARDGETVALVAHNAHFDVPILREEFVRADADLPDLPVLDTMAGLRTLGGITGGSASLVALLADLGLPPLGEDHHDALSDATACANAAVKLIARAEAAGCATLDDLLARAGGLRSRSVPSRAFREERVRPAVEAPPASHLADHENLDDLARLFADCARLRCERVSDVADMLPHEVVRPALLAQLAAVAAARDATGCATLLAGLAPMWATLPGGIHDARVEVPGLRHHSAGLGGSGQRGVAVSLAAWIEEVLAGIPRCPDTDYCPACADGLPCPRDAWAEAAAPVVVAETDNAAKGFWRHDLVTGDWGTTGRTYLVLAGASPALADAGLLRVLRYWKRENPSYGDGVADDLWAKFHRPPAVAERHAVRVLAAGSAADLRSALLVCESVLAGRCGSTRADWASLAVRARQIEAALTRLEARRDARHPRRPPRREPRPFRFRRQLPTGG